MTERLEAERMTARSGDETVCEKSGGRETRRDGASRIDVQYINISARDGRAYTRTRRVDDGERAGAWTGSEVAFGGCVRRLRSEVAFAAASAARVLHSPAVCVRR